QDVRRCANRPTDGRPHCRTVALYMVATPQRDRLHAFHETRLDTSPAIRLVDRQGDDSARHHVLRRHVVCLGRAAGPVADPWGPTRRGRLVRRTPDRRDDLRSLHVTGIGHVGPIRTSEPVHTMRTSWRPMPYP